MTKLRPGVLKKVQVVRCMGGNLKYRALRLDQGNFAWGTEGCTRKVRILDVVYNASNNELVRTKTLVKGAIVQVDATSFRQYAEKHYGVALGKPAKKDKKAEASAAAEEGKEVKKSKKLVKKLAERVALNPMESNVKDQFNQGRLLAAISSRPGQCGRCDGYILEGKELDFYLKKLTKKKA